MESKSTHGGYRKGAGRKTGENTIPLCIRISAEASEKLKSVQNKSKFINKLIIDS